MSLNEAMFNQYGVKTAQVIINQQDVGKEAYFADKACTCTLGLVKFMFILLN